MFLHMLSECRGPGFTSPRHKPMKVNEFLLSRYDKTSCYPSAEALLALALLGSLALVGVGLFFFLFLALVIGPVCLVIKGGK